MNTDSTEVLSIAFTGQCTISRADLERLLGHFRPAAISIQADQHQPSLPTQTEKPRLAYTMRETAETLGVSYQSIYRLVKRGLLRPSGALRTKVIARTEIERFLKESRCTDY
jgi:helix-turn-helix protein